MKPLLSLQLWSVQDVCAVDFEETLIKIKSYGYDGVEFAGYYGRNSESLKKILDNLSLEVSGSHISFDSLCNNFEEVVSYEKEIGNKNLIVPYIGAETLEEWEEKIAILKMLSDKLKEEGFDLGYHNHAHEINTIPNINILERMIELIPDIKLEIDTYWLAFAGIDVIQWLDQHKKNVDWLHLKDMKSDGEIKKDTEIMKGVLPIKSYLNWAKENNLEWVVIEQETFDNYPPIECAKLNVNALRSIQ